MNISLTPELEELIAEKVESGMYGSSSEVVRESLRLLKEHDRLQEIKLKDLRREIMIAVKQAERGEFLSESEVMGRIKTYRGKHLRKTSKK